MLHMIPIPINPCLEYMCMAWPDQVIGSVYLGMLVASLSAMVAALPMAIRVLSAALWPSTELIGVWYLMLLGFSFVASMIVSLGMFAVLWFVGNYLDYLIRTKRKTAHDAVS